MAQRVLAFRVGGRRWAVPLEAVREVLESPVIVRVPRARPHVAGLVLRHGVVVPVYNLSPGTAPPPHVLVIEWGELRNGIRVADPDAQQVVGKEGSGDQGAPCRGLVRFRDGAAESVDLEDLYRMLGIPTGGAAPRASL